MVAKTLAGCPEERGHVGAAVLSVSLPPSVCVCAFLICQPDDQGPPGSFNSFPGTWPRLNYGNPADSWNTLDSGTAEGMSRVVFFLSVG